MSFDTLGRSKMFFDRSEQFAPSDRERTGHVTSYSRGSSLSGIQPRPLLGLYVQIDRRAWNVTRYVMFFAALWRNKE